MYQNETNTHTHTHRRANEGIKGNKRWETDSFQLATLALTRSDKRKRKNRHI